MSKKMSPHPLGPQTQALMLQRTANRLDRARTPEQLRTAIEESRALWQAMGAEADGLPQGVQDLADHARRCLAARCPSDYQIERVIAASRAASGLLNGRAGAPRRLAG